MNVNIGKNTLGDSNKMSLSLREYGRSTHDLSYAWRSTMGVGVLTPFMKILALPGDTFNIDLENKIMTNPTIGPLFGSFKFQADIFTCPIRLYNAMLHNNALNVGMDMSKVKLPIVNGVNTIETKENGELSSSALMNFLELREERNIEQNGVAILAYYDIFKNYYANKQEKEFPMYTAIKIGEEIINNVTGQIQTSNNTAKEIINTLLTDNEENKNKFLASTITFLDEYENEYKIKAKNLKGNIYIAENHVNFETIESTVNLRINDLANPADIKIVNKGSLNNNLKRAENIKSAVVESEASIRKIEQFKLEEIDELRELILSKGKQVFNFGHKNKTNINFLDAATSIETQKEKLGGLCLKTYQGDVFTNWINSEWIDGENGIAKITAIDTSSGSFTMDTLNLAKKVYEMLNRIAISGGTYKDWIETVYTTDYYFRAETPVYEGGMSSEIEFEAITSLSASTADEYEPLGTLAGRGINANKKGGNITIKINEPCYIIGIASITPRVDYSQGVCWDAYLKTLNDLHKPQMDGIGYQDLDPRNLDWRAKSNLAIGKQPAWINYTTNYNKTFGEFAVGESMDYMVLNRPIKIDGNKVYYGVSSYIEPERYNNIFATEGTQEQNFQVQIGCGIECRRVMSARQIPNF